MKLISFVLAVTCLCSTPAHADELSDALALIRSHRVTDPRIVVDKIVGRTG